jgi:hypothetical protein
MQRDYLRMIQHGKWVWNIGVHNVDHLPRPIPN